MANEPFDPGADRQALMSVKAAPKQQRTHTRRDTLETCLTIPRLGVWLRLASRAWPMLCGREESRGRERERERKRICKKKNARVPSIQLQLRPSYLHVCMFASPKLQLEDICPSRTFKHLSWSKDEWMER